MVMTCIIPIQCMHSLIQDAKPNVQFVNLAQWRHFSSENAVITVSLIKSLIVVFTDVMNKCDTELPEILPINGSNVQTYKLPVLVILDISPLVLKQSPEPGEAL